MIKQTKDTATSYRTGALVVLSGGQDSTTCLFWAKENYPKVRAIIFDYGQLHANEINSARTVANMAGVPYEVVGIEDIVKSVSPLMANSGKELDKFDSIDDLHTSEVASTFVPMRNTLFLTIAANHALYYGFDTVVTGICQTDLGGYPDCTQKFLTKLEDTINESLGGGTSIKLVAPLMNFTKADTVELAFSMPDAWEALAYTLTSYDGKYPPTDNNHSNVLRADGFLQAGKPDPLVLRAFRENLMPLPETSNYDQYR